MIYRTVSYTTRAYTFTDSNMASQNGPLKVFLWTTPRTMSTSFLKCMTYVPDAVAWHEPYLQLGRFSYKIDDPMFSEPARELVEKHGGAPEVAKIKSGYDASDKDFDWLKEQLEADYPGKKLVFVKDMGASIGREFESRRDKIPKGFRHTFLIRNPQKVMMSQVKGFMKIQQSRGAFTNQKFTKDNIRPVQYLNEMWKYVKTQGLESNPIIIDSDELLENPKEILEAYCNEVGIPFTEDLLTWEAGDDVMTNQWMVPKQTILTFRAVGAHDGTFASTGFKKPAPSPGGMEQMMKQIPLKMMETFKEMMGRELPYYEEMFAQRLTLKK